MKRRTFVTNCLAGAGALSFVSPGAAAPPPGSRSRLFDEGWRFQRGDFEGGEQADFDDSAWRQLELPHDWSIEGPFSPKNPSGASGGFAPTGIGWYRKGFRLDEKDRGRTAWIEFDGVYENSTVWLNGHELGVQRYGYSSFHYLLTPHLLYGAENVIAVRVDNSRQPNCRWYSGSGIYRHVRLVVTDPLHVAHWGTYVTTPEVSSESAVVRLRTTVENDSDSATTCVLRTGIYDSSGQSVGTTQETARIAPGGAHESDQQIKVAAPELWSTEAPAMYEARTEVIRGGSPVDSYVTPFGIRTAVFDKDRGFLLNGEAVKMQGVCLHHDCGCLGAAVPIRAWERRFEILKSFGCNAIRTAHNPPSPEVLDLCDRMGFLVIDEVFDKWDLFRQDVMPIEWPEHWQDDLRATLERDRNHPSIILWSVGNETAQPGTPGLIQRIDELVGFARREEPSRPATTALTAVLDDVNVEEKERRTVEISRHVDVLSVNYQEQYYERYRELNPDTAIVGSECWTYYRGGLEQLIEFHEQNPWYDVPKHDYVTGQFLWPGIDYLGESMGWPSKGWPTGLIDTAGFLKPFSGFHRVVWKPDPAVHLAVRHDGLDRDNGPTTWHWPKLADHWNWVEGDMNAIEIHSYSNCESVELFVNDRSYGVRRTADFSNNTIVWHVEYEPGKLIAIARNGGREVARDELTTASKPARIELLPDRSTLAATGDDLSHIEVRLVDENGVLVQDSDRRITFLVEGAGRLAGVDNGDMRSTEPYQAPYRTTRHGRCLLIVRSLRGPGRIRVTARTDGLEQTQTEIMVT